MSDPINELLKNNRDWAAQTIVRDAQFFAHLTALQDPDYMWIGCSDNLVQHDDLNCMAALEYAVAVLRVRHVIVCGHYGCGGVQASFTGDAPKNVHKWLGPVHTMYARERANLDGLDDSAKLDRLCEINVLQQKHSLCQTHVVQNAWNAGQELSVHAWIYNIGDGLLQILETTTRSNTESDTT
jgi:carbonic anhydrase